MTSLKLEVTVREDVRDTVPPNTTITLPSSTIAQDAQNRPHTLLLPLPAAATSEETDEVEEDEDDVVVKVMVELFC